MPTLLREVFRRLELLGMLVGMGCRVWREIRGVGGYGGGIGGLLGFLDTQLTVSFRR